jgi:hypothetical protein
MPRSRVLGVPVCAAASYADLIERRVPERETSAVRLGSVVAELVRYR